MISPDVTKRLRTLAKEHGLKVAQVDHDRPWGGEFIFEGSLLDAFVESFFPDLDRLKYDKLLDMPKFLVVSPNQRMSWQYHKHRGELWRVVTGPVGVITSPTDQPGDQRELINGEEIETAPLERHRLVGLDVWGVVAELWVHADPDNPSSEDDIIRVADDYGR